MRIYRMINGVHGRLEVLVEDERDDDETQVGFENRMIQMLNRVAYEPVECHEFQPPREDS